MGTKLILAALLLATLVLPYAAADITATVTDPTTQQMLLQKRIGSTAVSCYEAIGNSTMSNSPNCQLNL